MITKAKRAQDIQDAITKVLIRDWDPIGVSDFAETQDEYDRYAGGIYRCLANGATVQEIADHLSSIESDEMGLSPTDSQRNLLVARKLKEIDISLKADFTE